MNCKEIEKLIPKFIKNECTQAEEEMLLAHIKTCPDCKEELTIQFLLDEGLNRLEAGESFDLNAELEKRLAAREQEKKMQPRESRLTSEQWVVIVDIIGGAILVAIMIGLLVGFIHF